MGSLRDVLGTPREMGRFATLAAWRGVHALLAHRLGPDPTGG